MVPVVVVRMWPRGRGRRPPRCRGAARVGARVCTRGMSNVLRPGKPRVSGMVPLCLVAAHIDGVRAIVDARATSLDSATIGGRGQVHCAAVVFDGDARGPRGYPLQSLCSSCTSWISAVGL